MTGRTAAKQDDDRAKLREEHPDSWIAVEEGDYLTGQVTDVQEAWSDVRQQGSWYPLLTIKVDDATGYETGAEIKVHAFGAVLYNEIMRRRPEIGETVTITYDGTREPKQRDMSPTNVYSVRVHGRTQEGAGVYGRIASEQPASTVGRRKESQPEPATGPESGNAGPADDDIPF